MTFFLSFSYVKGSDKDNWLTIDDKTGDIKLNKIPDRESPYLVNGTYMAEILCITQGIYHITNLHEHTREASL